MNLNNRENGLKGLVKVVKLVNLYTHNIYTYPYVGVTVSAKIMYTQNCFENHWQLQETGQSEGKAASFSNLGLTTGFVLVK